MKRAFFLFVVSLLLVGCSRHPQTGMSLAQVRQGFKTRLTRFDSAREPVPEPPPALFQIVHYDSPAGKLAAYLSPSPSDGRKHPAILWITGGDCNTIGDVWQHAVLDERAASTMKAYVAQRKLVGRLTAEISFLLIRDSLSSQKIDCCRMMNDIGAVGCLVDSIIDRRDDDSNGAVSFHARSPDVIRLWVATIWNGFTLIVIYRRLLPLLVDALRDNFHDRKRSQAKNLEPVNRFS